MVLQCMTINGTGHRYNIFLQCNTHTVHQSSTAHAHTRVRTRTNTHTNTHTHIHTQTHTHMHPHTHTSTKIQMHSDVHTRVHTHTHTRTHTHTQIMCVNFTNHTSVSSSSSLTIWYYTYFMPLKLTGKLGDKQGSWCTQPVTICYCSHPCHEHQSGLTLNVLHHTTPHKLCRHETKDMHGLQCFSSTDSGGSENLLFILCLNQESFF